MLRILTKKLFLKYFNFLLNKDTKSIIHDWVENDRVFFKNSKLIKLNKLNKPNSIWIVFSKKDYLIRFISKISLIAYFYKINDRKLILNKLLNIKSFSNLEDIVINNFNHQIQVFVFIENLTLYKKLKQNYSNELMHLFLKNLQLNSNVQINFIFNKVTYEKIKDDSNLKEFKVILV